MPKLFCELKLIMAEKGISGISELSKKTGVSRVALTKLINNETTRMDFNTTVCICDYLGCEVGDLYKILSDQEYERRINLINKRREKLTEGHVYFVKNPINNLVKIGRSSHFEGRLNSLEAQHKTELEVLLLIESDETDVLERAFHTKYKEFRSFGEWFDLPDQELTLLDAEKINKEGEAI